MLTRVSTLYQTYHREFCCHFGKSNSSLKLLPRFTRYPIPTARLYLQSNFPFCVALLIDLESISGGSGLFVRSRSRFNYLFERVRFARRDSAVHVDVFFTRMSNGSPIRDFPSGSRNGTRLCYDGNNFPR